MRELGMGLPEIAEVLDGETDEVSALRKHHEQLLSDIDRLHELADTVARTIEEREGGEPMSAEEIFRGFAETRTPPKRGNAGATRPARRRSGP